MAGRIVNVLRSAPALLLAPESYLRTVFVLTGAAHQQGVLTDVELLRQRRDRLWLPMRRHRRK